MVVPDEPDRTIVHDIIYDELVRGVVRESSLEQYLGVIDRVLARPGRESGMSGDRLRTPGRWLLGLALLGAGIGHLTTQRTEFQAQVPDWFPLDADFVVLASGVVEILLGAALLSGWRRVHVGWVVAVFFVVIFPGNIAQLVEGTDAFGLDTDTKRVARLFFQPVLVAWALWSTGAWRDRRELRERSDLPAAPTG